MVVPRERREAHFKALCRLGRSDITLLMVETGSIPGGVDSQDKLSCTPTYLASIYGLKDVVTALIEAGADINLAVKDGGTPLFVASQEGHVEVVRELLRGGASIDQAMKNDFTPLCIASQNGHL